MKTSSSCELTPRVPSPPPCQLPPGPWTSLASSALCLDCLHANPSTTSVDQRAEACPYPTTVRLSGCRLRPTSSKGAAKRRVKSGNFNWFYRQFYYALNTPRRVVPWSPSLVDRRDSGRTPSGVCTPPKTCSCRTHVQGHSTSKPRREPRLRRALPLDPGGPQLLQDFALSTPLSQSCWPVWWGQRADNVASRRDVCAPNTGSWTHSVCLLA